MVSYLNMLLEELPIVMEEGRHGVFGQDVAAHLCLHESKVLGNVLLVFPKVKQIYF